ncbi:syntaxin-7-like [Pecten maximus]|uniref:syntaxin-7-like n=1 Tax=Pecten maximus TaxID=6579 RepID=UPI0014588582|nr:syntaxin-7-like [Pecten maximus]XP_033752916.1 syntaxin-7-like [Pecten maximus]
MASNDFPSYGSTVRQYRDDPDHTDYSDRPNVSRYSDTCDQVSGNISNINSGANSLERAMKIIGTDRDSVQLRDRIHDTSQKTKRIVQETTKLMKTLASMRHLERQQKFKIDRLQSDFEEAVRRFTTLQKNAAEKVKTSVKLSTPKSQDLLSGGWDDGDDKTAFVEQERRREELQEQGQVIEDDLALISEREERIRQLEADVLDVNEIFKDLNVMIHEQGEAVDSIEANVERAYGNVEQGTGHLGKAAEYQKKSRKKMCILVVILVVVAAVVAIIIYLSVKK